VKWRENERRCPPGGSRDALLLLVADRQSETEVLGQLVLRVETVGKVDAPHATVGVDLRAYQLPTRHFELIDWHVGLVSGVTSHRQPRQCRGAQGPKTVKGAQSDLNYVPILLLDCVATV